MEQHLLCDLMCSLLAAALAEFQFSSWASGAWKGHGRVASTAEQRAGSESQNLLPSWSQAVPGWQSASSCGTACMGCMTPWKWAYPWKCINGSQLTKGKVSSLWLPIVKSAGCFNPSVLSPSGDVSKDVKDRLDLDWKMLCPLGWFCCETQWWI